MYDLDQTTMTWDEANNLFKRIKISSLCAWFDYVHNDYEDEMMCTEWKISYVDHDENWHSIYFYID